MAPPPHTALWEVTFGCVTVTSSSLSTFFFLLRAANFYLRVGSSSKEQSKTVKQRVKDVTTGVCCLIGKVRKLQGEKAK